MQNGRKREMTLYSTDACHLCEEAQALLDRVVGDTPGVRYVIMDISHSDALFERYGWHIPVVRFADGEELNWPFDELAVRRHLQELLPS